LELKLWKDLARKDYGIQTKVVNMKKTVKLATGFRDNQRGSVVIMFSLSLVAICLAVGVAVDYSRSSNARTTVQSALDAAVLIAGKEALATGKKATPDSIRTTMLSNLKAQDQSLAKEISVTQSDTELLVIATGDVKLAFGGVIGKEKIEFTTRASVPLASSRLEVALVVDSTGSMGRLGKMEALKKASVDLIDFLALSQRTGTEISYGIVPFSTQVRVPTTFGSADWIDFRTSEPNPKLNANRTDWDGCIMDRDKPNNTKVSKPTPGRSEEKQPAQNCTSTGLQPILPLTNNTNTVKARINSLVADGNTNTTIGMAWGYNILTPGNPMGDGASTSGNKPVQAIVFLTDGLNTADRFEQPSSAMDLDMAELCRTAKTSKIRVFTIRVVEGNDALLQDCASNPADFYKVNEASGLFAAFKSIAEKLMTLRLSS
jgi:Flp pilus assembly protein TadG